MKAQGFTLLELLVALAIFALIGLSAHRVLITVLASAEVTHARHERLGEVQRALSLIGQDIVQMTPRPRRDGAGRTRPPLEAGAEGNLLSFTRRGWESLAAMRRSRLQPIVYRLEGGVLWRYYWNALDPVPGTPPLAQPLLQNVGSVHLRFYERPGGWRDEWPGASAQSLPDAVEVMLDTREFGSIRRVWEVAHE